ncbi:MAG: urate oxidase [Actinophytocola sp.]|nr:urate oxidase [Actinophytocola sp.]
MTIQLGANQYGKAETRLVHVTRGAEAHEIVDLNVTTTLSGDLADTHLTGDNAKVLPTDTQKNTVFAFAKEHGVGEIEDFALRLARHFVSTQDPIHRARVSVEQYGWERIDVGDAPAPHSFQRTGRETRTAMATVDDTDGERAWVVSGLKDLVVLNTTGSEFWGYPKDRYTTLAETHDRILATAVNAQWRHCDTGSDWGKSYDAVRAHLTEAFATTHSLSLQQTLYAMGERVLEHCPEIAEVRLSLPNKHHFVVDLAPFGLDNDNEVFFAADRPYGLIEGTVVQDTAPEPGLAW